MTRSTALRAGFVVILLGTAGCAARYAPSIAPGSTGAPPGEPSIAPTAATAPTAPDAPIEWVRVPRPRSLDDAHLEQFVAFPNGFAAVGCRWAELEGQGRTCVGPAVWLSRDGVTWGERIDLPLATSEASGNAFAITTGPAGYLIGGQAENNGRVRAALWSSADGSTFDRVDRGEGFDDASVAAVATVDARFVAVGFGAFLEAAGFAAWWSDDATTWTAGKVTAEAEGFPQAVLNVDGVLTAWGPSCGVCVPETHWWSSVDGSVWTASGTAPGLAGASLDAVAAVDSGLLAAGGMQDDLGSVERGMWERAAGEDRWVRATAPQIPADASIEHLLGIPGGVVGAASLSRGQQFSALVVARASAASEWEGLAELMDLVVVDVAADPADPRRIFVVGHSGPDGEGPVVIWVGGVDWPR